MKSKEEANYRRFRNLGKALGVPVFEAFLELEVLDKHGKRLSYHRQRSHSWVRNAYNMLFSQMASKDADDTTFGAGKLSIKDTAAGVNYADRRITVAKDGVTCDTPASTTQGYLSPAGNDDWGILIGIGTDAESFEDYVLQTQIVDGTGSGEMSYVESESHSITYTAGTKVLKDEQGRYFNNNSGDTIGVNEVGMVTRGRVSGDHSWLVARDKLASAVNVPDTGQLKVTYTIQLTYPA